MIYHSAYKNVNSNSAATASPIKDWALSGQKDGQCGCLSIRRSLQSLNLYDLMVLKPYTHKGFKPN
jgi:hypothetical protein